MSMDVYLLESRLTRNLSYCLYYVQLQNLVAAKADEGAVDEQREGLETALQASTSSLGSLLDSKADSIQVCPPSSPNLCGDRQAQAASKQM